MEYVKPRLFYERQTDLLIDGHGLIVDYENLVCHLQKIGRYCLSGCRCAFERSGTSASEDGYFRVRFVEGCVRETHE